MANCSRVGLRFVRNPHGEAYVAWLILGYDQISALNSRDVSRNRKSKTCSVRFGGVERFKDSGQHFFRNRVTRIFDLELHTLSGRTATTDHDPSPNGRGIDRVEEKVEDSPLQLLAINVRPQSVFILDCDPDSSFRSLHIGNLRDVA